MRLLPLSKNNSNSGSHSDGRLETLSFHSAASSLERRSRMTDGTDWFTGETDQGVVLYVVVESRASMEEMVEAGQVIEDLLMDYLSVNHRTNNNYILSSRHCHGRTRKSAQALTGSGVSSYCCHNVKKEVAAPASPTLMSMGFPRQLHLPLARLCRSTRHRHHRDVIPLPVTERSAR
ncbi:hypothetical protein SAY86_025173 [Trapa natans]|uniref:Uncharacterized protein n=1 Tax=Trapa natans TaxID=22666 RepID=A0AAN7MWH9_TRANT|nr:hypothetical protein SAY86_025173 [Trapa natans]